MLLFGAEMGALNRGLLKRANTCFLRRFSQSFVRAFEVVLAGRRLDQATPLLRGCRITACHYFVLATLGQLGARCFVRSLEVPKHVYCGFHMHEVMWA